MYRNIAIIAGGTGGHISPGVALAEQIVQNMEQFQVNSVYIHSLTRNKDNPDLKQAPCEVIWHDTPQPADNYLFFPFKFLSSFFKTKSIFKSKKIDTIIIMGGYSTLPALFYAIFYNKQIYICEQNRKLGKVNRIFLKYGHKLGLSFPIELQFNLPTQILGNPLRIKTVPKNEDVQKKIENISIKDKLNILVMGGSQGARQINHIAIAAMDNSEISQNYNFRILTGTNLYDEVKQKAKSDVELIAYSDDMKSHYAWADLILARSGAGVVFECMAHGLFMILVPYPFAADNHQEANAEYLEKNIQAKVLYQKDENPNELIQILKEYSKNKMLLQELSQKSLLGAKVDAAYQTAKFFLT